MLKIAVGTTSKWKLKEINKVLKEAKIKAEIFPIDVISGVASQPRKINETKQGSINRAKAALKNNHKAEIGLGIEVGYEPINNSFFMHGWSSIIDRDGNIYSEQSSTLELPKFFLKYLNDENELGDHVEEFENMFQKQQWKNFSDIVRYREPFIKESVRNVIIRYFFRDQY